MATQRLVLIHPHEAEILKEKDFITTQKKVTAEITVEDTAEYTAMDNAMDIAKENMKIKVLGKLSGRQS